MINRLSLLFSFAFFLPINGNQNEDLLLPAQPMFGLTDAKVYKSVTTNDFYVIHENKKHTVKKHWNSSLLYKMNDTQLKEFLVNGYITVNKMSNNEFTLKAKVRGLGGGVGGATAGVFAGATIVQSAYWGLTGGIGLAATAIGGPITASAVVGVWCYWTAVPLAIATKTAAVAGGIAGAVATGPV